MKNYIVMINYGMYEGYKIKDECDTLEEAIKIKELAMTTGHEVVIFKLIQIEHKEILT